jgi:hypothetical protein
MGTTSLVQGKVKYAPGKPKQTQYGERINAVITLADGQEVKLWGNPDDAITQLRKGESVTLSHDGKSYKFVGKSLQATENPTEPSPNAERWSDDHRSHIFKELQRRAGVLACCHQEVKKRFTNPQNGELAITEESMQKYVISLYLDLKDLW